MQFPVAPTDSLTRSERTPCDASSKRLERGCFEIPRDADERGQVTLDATALAMLLGGVPLATPRRPRYTRPAAAPPPATPAT
jgi:hypothetical protein